MIKSLKKLGKKCLFCQKEDYFQISGRWHKRNTDMLDCMILENIMAKKTKKASYKLVNFLNYN